MATTRTPQELIADASTGGNANWFVESQAPTLHWLSQTDAAGLAERLTALKADKARDDLTAQRYERFTNVFSLPLVLASMALSIQIFGRLFALENPIGFLGLGVTLSIFAPLLALFLWATRKVKKLDLYERNRFIESLSPLDSQEQREMEKLARQSQRAREWLELVSTQQRRPLCERDMVLLRYLAAADRRENEPAMLKELHDFQSGEAAEGADMALEALFRKVRHLGRLPSTAWDRLNATEDELLRKETEAGAIIEKQHRKSALVDRFERPGGLVANMLVGLACGVAGWRIITLSDVPGWLGWFVMTGLGLVAVGLVVFGSILQGAPDSYHRAHDLLREIKMLDDNGVYEMLEALQDSADARAWHTHVVHTLRRKLRWQDMSLVRTLAYAEKQQT